MTDAVSKKHGAHAGPDKIAEYKKHAGNRHRRSQHKTEGSIKEEVPEANAEAEAFGFFVVHGNEQKLLAEDVVENSHQRVENGGLAHFRPGDGENIADEHVFEVLGLTRGFAHEQDGHGRSNGVSNTDEGFLRDVAAAGGRGGRKHGAENT